MKSSTLRRYTKLFLLFLAFGAFQVFHGLFAGHPPLTAARDLAFNYYTFYFFLGLYIGLQDKKFLPNFLRLAAWVNGLYGILYILTLSRVSWTFPGVSNDVGPVPVLGMPEFSAVILLGLLSFERDLRRVWLLLLLNAAVLLGMVIRAEWVAFAFGLLVWACCTKNLKRVAVGGGVILLLVALMYVANFTMAGPETRGGTISATEVVARVIAPVSSDLAAEYSSDSSDAHMYEGDAVWRTIWWTAIWNSAHESFPRALFGHGYGFALGDLVPYLEGEFIRTPHNVFFYALGYTGWIGVVIFASLQAELGRLLWSVRQATGAPFGIVFWLTMLTFSVFTPFFEIPQGAIPFYLVAGCACAPLFYAKKSMPVGSTEGIESSGSSNSQNRRNGPSLGSSGIGVAAS